MTAENESARATTQTGKFIQTNISKSAGFNSNANSIKYYVVSGNLLQVNKFIVDSFFSIICGDNTFEFCQIDNIKLNLSNLKIYGSESLDGAKTTGTPYYINIPKIEYIGRDVIESFRGDEIYINFPANFDSLQCEGSFFRRKNTIFKVHYVNYNSNYGNELINQLRSMLHETESVSEGNLCPPENITLGNKVSIDIFNETYFKTKQNEINTSLTSAYWENNIDGFYTK